MLTLCHEKEDRGSNQWASLKRDRLLPHACTLPKEAPNEEGRKKERETEEKKQPTSSGAGPSIVIKEVGVRQACLTLIHIDLPLSGTDAEAAAASILEACAVGSSCDGRRLGLRV